MKKKNYHTLIKLTYRDQDNIERLKMIAQQEKPVCQNSFVTELISSWPRSTKKTMRSREDNNDECPGNQQSRQRKAIPR